MKKSIIIAVLILILVIAWFLSGQLFNKQNFANVDLDQKNRENQTEINGINVETILSSAEEIDQSILLQGQTIVNRSINLKAETTGNITNKNFSRGDIVNINDVLVEISIEDREELLNSFHFNFFIYYFLLFVILF